MLLHGLPRYPQLLLHVVLAMVFDTQSDNALVDSLTENLSEHLAEGSNGRLKKLRHDILVSFLHP
jgi:hypothetical protein